MSLIYPEGDIQPLDNQILMNYIEGNGSNTRDVQQSNFSDISNEKLEEHKAEALNDNLKDKKTEKLCQIHQSLNLYMIKRDYKSRIRHKES